MADAKISDLSAGGAIQTGDFLPAARSGSNVKLPGTSFLVKIYDSTLGSAVSSFDTGASSIPSGFSGLQLLFYGRGDTAAGSIQAYLTFNNDTGGNYDQAVIRNSGNSTNATATTASTYVIASYIPAASATANFFGSTSLFIPSYDSTSGYKAGTTVHGFAHDNTSGIEAWSSTFSWRSTSAINRIILTASAGNFVTGSRLTIYGLP